MSEHLKSIEIPYKVSVFKRIQGLIGIKKYPVSHSEYRIFLAEKEGFGKLRCRRHPAGGEQHATGMLYLYLQIQPFRCTKKNHIRWDVVLFYGGEGGI